MIKEQGTQCASMDCSVTHMVWYLERCPKTWVAVYWKKMKTAIQSIYIYIKRASYTSMHTHFERCLFAVCACMHACMQVYRCVWLCKHVSVPTHTCVESTCVSGLVWGGGGVANLLNKTCFPIDDSWLSWQTHTLLIVSRLMLGKGYSTKHHKCLMMTL